MLNFKNKIEKIIVNYFIKYNINPNPVNDGKIIDFDRENQIHHTNTIASTSNLNVAVSKHLETEKQFNKATKIIKEYQDNKEPFTWVIVANDQNLKEKEFFEKNGFVHSETIIAMIINLEQFNNNNQLSENEKFQEVKTLDDVETFRKIITDAFPLNLIDLEKYQGLYELRKTKKIDYLVYFSVDDKPVSTGQFYFEDELVIIDDIATSPEFQRHGYGKKMLNHLLSTAKAMGYKQAALIATPEGFGLYKKLGFEPFDLYFDVFELNYNIKKEPK